MFLSTLSSNRYKDNDSSKSNDDNFYIVVGSKIEIQIIEGWFLENYRFTFLRSIICSNHPTNPLRNSFKFQDPRFIHRESKRGDQSQMARKTAKWSMTGKVSRVKISQHLV